MERRSILLKMWPEKPAWPDLAAPKLRDSITEDCNVSFDFKFRFENCSAKNLVGHSLLLNVTLSLYALRTVKFCLAHRAIKSSSLKCEKRPHY